VRGNFDGEVSTNTTVPGAGVTLQRAATYCHRSAVHGVWVWSKKCAMAARQGYTVQLGMFILCFLLAMRAVVGVALSLPKALQGEARTLQQQFKKKGHPQRKRDNTFLKVGLRYNHRRRNAFWSDR
jgi:hypothetical protein